MEIMLWFLDNISYIVPHCAVRIMAKERRSNHITRRVFAEAKVESGSTLVQIPLQFTVKR